MGMDDGELIELYQLPSKDGRRTSRWKRGDVYYAALAWKSADGYKGIAELARSGQPAKKWCPHMHSTWDEAVACAEGIIIDAEMMGWGWTLES